MLRILFVAAFATLLTRASFAGNVITTNLPANTAIINISGTADGAVGYDGTQDKWYQPFSAGGAVALLKFTIQPGTYTFRLTNPTMAASQFPSLTGSQLSSIYTAWTYNSPWVTDYMVWDLSAADDGTIPQLFSGAITPTSDYPGYSDATAAFNTAELKGFANQIIDSPGGRHTGTIKSQRTFQSSETLIFGVPDSGLFDNDGGVSVVISPVGAGIAGDYNANGTVDAADYVVWRNGGPLQNEIATLGSATSEDYTEWRKRFGNFSGSGAGELAGLGGGVSVPEPAAWLMIAVGAAVSSFSRTRRR